MSINEIIQKAQELYFATDSLPEFGCRLDFIEKVSELNHAVQELGNSRNDPETESVWAIIELMGHVKTGARISQDTKFGTALMRADVPQADGSFVTQLINPSSLYRVTICNEEIARVCAGSNQAKPMQRWELQHLLPQGLVAPAFEPDSRPYSDAEEDLEDR